MRVYGSNLTPPYFSLWFNGVEYTPLDYGDGYVDYVLQDNGTYEIRNESDIVMKFKIEGSVVPTFLPVDITAWQKLNGGIYGSDSTTINRYKVTRRNCINYAEVLNDEYPYFLFSFDSADVLSSELSFHNCSLYNSSFGTSPTRLNVSIIDPNEVAYITYQNFIIAVFNYTTTP